MRVTISSVMALAPVAVMFHAAVVNAQLVNLGAAGNFAILETGNQNVSLAAAPPNGFINGNVGAAGGNLSDGGNLPITGNVYLGSAATSGGLAGNVGGTIYQNYDLSAAVAAAANAATTAAGLATAGGGVGITTINEGGNTMLTLQPGVYNLANFELGNGSVVTLAAGGSYVFNISGTLSLNSAKVLVAAGLSTADVLYNVTGTQAVGFSGGLNNECVLDGVLLAENAQVHLTPGFVDPEIISGQSINIASGGSVDNPSSVPEPSTIISGLLLLIPLGVSTVRILRKGRITNPVVS